MIETNIGRPKAWRVAKRYLPGLPPDRPAWRRDEASPAINTDVLPAANYAPPVVGGYRFVGPQTTHHQMLQSHGLTHVSLAVHDLERKLKFYIHVFGMREYCRDAPSIQVHSHGPHDVVAFECDPNNAGVPGAIAHFDFRLQNAKGIGLAIAERAGGTVLGRRGEFSPGYPYAYVADPHGYEIGIRYE
jgi:catechol 2,3-dioxygenase-like lactoylglutathione lyase family enzyme